MAFQAVEGAAVETPVTAPVSETGKKSGADLFKAEGASIRSTMTDEEKSFEGSKSEKVEFICALGNPAKSRSRIENKQNIPSHDVVGYKFRLLEAMDVPVAPIKGTNLLDFDAITWVPAQEGEVVNLTVIEAGAFISKVEFGGKFTGNGTDVALTLKTAKDRPTPRPVLQSKTGSIKATMELIADMVGATADHKGKPVVKEEYAEKFGILFQPRTASRKGSGAAPKTESCKDIAAAFRSFYQTKQA